MSFRHIDYETSNGPKLGYCVLADMDYLDVIAKYPNGDLEHKRLYRDGKTIYCHIEVRGLSIRVENPDILFLPVTQPKKFEAQ